MTGAVASIKFDVDIDVIAGLAVISMGVADDQKLVVGVTPEDALQMAQLLIERAVTLDPDAPARVQRASEAAARLHAGHNEVVRAARESVLAQQRRMNALRETGRSHATHSIGN